MYRSLQKHCPSARLWLLCLSQECHEALTHLALPNLSPIRLEDFEKGDEALLAAKANRNDLEYYFTCSPSLPLYVFKNNPEIDLVTYLDADLYFFSDPEPVFAEMGSRSIAIIAHRFPAKHQHMDRNGKFNVGWLSFHRDEEGMACLKLWRNQCLEWCHDYIDGDRFADQKYLDRWPALFKNLTIIEHKGANVAAWNIANFRFHQNRGKLWMDEQPLIFYHFQGMRRIAPCVYDPCVEFYSLRISWIMEFKLFRPYIRVLRGITAEIASLIARASSVSGLQRRNGETGWVAPVPSNFREHVRRLAMAYRGVAARRYLLIAP